MSYTAGWNVVAFEQPTAAKWNQLGANDDSFHDGTGIGNAVITNPKLNLSGGQQAVVATSEATTNTSFTDLTTTTDSVTVTVGASGIVLLIYGVNTYNATSGQFCYISFQASGANAITAGTHVINEKQGAVGEKELNQTRLLRSLSAGSTTFKMKYRVGGGTGNFANRYIIAIPL